jgi:hypothetical protein
MVSELWRHVVLEVVTNDSAERIAFIFRVDIRLVLCEKQSFRAKIKFAGNL